MTTKPEQQPASTVEPRIGSISDSDLVADLEQQLAAKERNLEMYRETIAGYEKQLGVPQRADSIGSAIEKLQSMVVPAQWLMRDTQDPVIDELTRLREMRAELDDSRDNITATRLKIEGLEKEVKRLKKKAGEW